MMKNKGEEKEPEMVAEGGGQHLAQGKGRSLSYIPWVGWPCADWMEEKEKWLDSRPSVVQTFCCIQGAGVEGRGKMMKENTGCDLSK